MPKLSLLAGAAAIGLILVGSFLALARARVSHSVPEPQVTAVVTPERTGGESSAADSEIPSNRLKAVPKRTVRDALQEYYGDEWELKRSAIEASMGTKLDKPFEEFPLRPWEEVSEELRMRLLPNAAVIASQVKEALEWDPERVSSWDAVRVAFRNVPENMRDIELQEFRAIAEEENARIGELAERRSAALADLCAYKWSRGEYVKAPYCLPTSKQSVPGGRIARAQLITSSSTGWVVAMPVYGDELPEEYDILSEAVEKGIHDRTKRLSQYLDSKK